MSDPNAPRYPEDQNQPTGWGQSTPGYEMDPVTGRPIEPIASGPMQPMPDQGPTQAWYPEGAVVAPPPKKRNWLPLVALVVIVGLIGGAYYLFKDRLSTSVSDVGVGDCIDEPATTDAISELQRQPCNEPHDGEVFATVTHTAASGAPYPPSTDFDDLVSDECVPKLEAYTGRTITEVIAAGLDFSYLYPTSSSWGNGDRGVTCYLTKTDDTKMIGSIRSTGGATSAPASAPATP